ncbi:bifunctional homocysteine S-methyltransferase/methylenetetrahydrofolate reductase [Geomicrobium sediminis]|uniref:Homocysteine S-methyltransferase n=1 Tax=Geomicrobium sediminis TaxID=1347788 RepID=A0ABS2PFE4_9BACL|nr:bifunctional homocysteine S-methyltransferase/methylenetetrahydrofolate reductase [Geomicrobium sediminis]MBM7633553.1 homocysteine S-methyltransferase [Geomicrobium sediminis]
MSFLERLKETVLIGDGAMGTLLYSRDITGSIEQANLYAPELVYEAHLEYVQAGADIIQSNTYAANRIKLDTYGLDLQVAKINKEGMKLAKKAAAFRPNVYVAATIGGIKDGRTSDWTDDQIDETVTEQIVALLSENPDVVLLETYYDLHELIRAIRIVRKHHNTIPIIANVSLGDIGVLHGGISLTEALKRLQKEGANVVGVNCRMGPAQTITSLKETEIPKGLFLSAYPNASLPGIRDGRLVYQSNPNYFKAQASSFRELGINIIGGCCGTTPEHIRGLKERLKGLAPLEKRTVVIEETTDEQVEANESNQQVYDANVIVELDPPKSLSKMPVFLKGAEALVNAGADSITLADNSLATSRVDNVAAATLIQQKTQASPLVHIACRDRNLIGMQSHLLGLHTLGVKEVLAITGDPTKVGDFPGASSVYDLTSFDLIAMLKGMNEGYSYSGRPLGVKTSFTVGAAFNPNVSNLEKAIKRLEKKITAGADFIMTQPMYDKEQIKRLKDYTKHLSIPIFIGVMPLVNERNAEFLHNEVPGIFLSDTVRSRMQKTHGDPQKGEEEGLRIAEELQQTCIELFGKVYIVTPFLKYHMSTALVEHARSLIKTSSVMT